MKFVKRNWSSLTTVVLIFGALVILVIAQTARTASAGNGTANPGNAAAAGAKPAPAANPKPADAARLIDALNAGDSATALTILRAGGIADETIKTLTAGLGKPAARASLSEPFLKASVVMSPLHLVTNPLAHVETSTSIGYQRPVLSARRLGPDWQERSDREVQQSPLPPIAVLNLNLDDPDFIQFFQWYDRYADQLHSVVLNGENLNNAKLDSGYDRANRTLNALFRLIKARKPDAFVWLTVIKEDDRSDERWLRAMTFKPDGLQISNLRQFHSPFADTHRRYAAIVGDDVPMMVSGFYGQKAALEDRGKALASAKKIEHQQTREAAETAAASQIGGLGQVIAPEFAQLESHLQSAGYRGLSVHPFFLEALANQKNGNLVSQSDLIDSRTGLLDGYQVAGDFKSMAAITTAMLADATPGDLNWTVAKLYEGIRLLSQSPPDTDKANAVLDEVLKSDFKGKPGRDHYVLGAVRWRMYSAFITGDVTKADQLSRWVENNDFRQDLKASFLKNSGGSKGAPGNQAK